VPDAGLRATPHPHHAVCPGAVDTPIVEQAFHKITDDLDTRVADRLMLMLPGGAIAPAESARRSCG
jgi:hypothetical protein